MAFFKDTAANHVDFFDRLVATMRNQGWEQVWRVDTNGLILAGPGTTGAKVYVGLRLSFNQSAGSYYLTIFGMSGVIPGATRLEDHANVSLPKYMFLDNAEMVYWLSISDRRVVCTVQISTVFQAFYAGLMLPFAIPSIYPYPMVVAGSAGSIHGNLQNWRSVDEGHSLMNSPRQSGDLGKESGMTVMGPDGQWLRAVNQGAQVAPFVTVAPDNMGEGWGMSRGGSFIQLGYLAQRNRIARCYKNADGSPLYAFQPLSIMSPNTDATLGMLDGVFFTPGVDNSAINELTLNGIVHLVVGNVFRTGTGDYFAMQLS